MRIIHVITDLRLGGAETALVGLARACAAQGHRVEVVALKQLGMAAAPLVSSGIACTALGAPDTPGIGLLDTVVRLQAYLRKRPVDVIHAWLASGCAATHLAVALRQPRVYSVQVTDTPPPAVCAILSSGNGPRIQWVAASRAAAESWTRVLRKPNMRVVPNTVDVEGKPEPEPEGARPLFLGRLAHQKGLDVLLHALVGTKLVVDIHGTGPLEAELKGLAEQLGVTENAKFLGATSSPLDAIRHASLLLLPSRSEGMPLVVLEAMACGRAVLATGVGGTDEVVVPEETGVLIPAEDPDALRHALLRLSGDVKLRGQMGLAGHARYRKHFRHDVVVAQFLDAYRMAGAR